jgi:hypothetical protein
MKPHFVVRDFQIPRRYLGRSAMPAHKTIPISRVRAMLGVFALGQRLAAQRLTQRGTGVLWAKPKNPRAPERFVERSRGAHIQNTPPIAAPNASRHSSFAYAPAPCPLLKKSPPRACKPGSVGVATRAAPPTAIPLRRRLPAASSSLPGSRNEPDRLCSLFGLAPGGVYRARRVAPPAGALLPHRFTLTACFLARMKQVAVYFLWHFPWPCDRWTLSTTLSCGARTFLPRGSEEPSPATVQPSMETFQLYVETSRQSTRTNPTDEVV